MPAININDLNNAQLDVNTIASVATSTAPTVTDRLGNTKNTLSGMNAAVLASAAAVQGSLGYLPPVAYAAGISLTLAAQTVGYSGQTYAPLLSALPFTTSGTFETANFRLIQGVSSADLAASTGALMVSVLADGVGATARNLQDALRDSVSVFSYMSAAQKADVRSNSGLIDVTDAWNKAQDASDTVFLPAGTYRLTNFRPKTFKKFIGVGRHGTKIKQADPAQYAFNALSDVSTGQLISIALKGVHFIGSPSAAVSVFNCEANGSYVVYDSDFDYSVENSYQALRIVCPDANNVYNCRFRVSSAVTAGVSAITAGVYNAYDLFLTGTQAQYSIRSIDFHADFSKVITEAAQLYSGQNNWIKNATIENWTGAPSETAIWLQGYNNTLANTALITVPNAKANIAYKLSNTNRILGAKVTGVFPGFCPQFSLQLDTNAAGVVMDFQSDAPTKVEATSPITSIQNIQWLGDCRTVTDSQRFNGAPLFFRAQPISGATVAFSNNVDAIVLQPNSAIAALTIALPTIPKNGQLVRVSTSQAISALTVTASAGQSIGPNAFPPALSAGSSFAMLWEAAVGFWWAMS